MRNSTLVASVLAATAIMFVAGYSSNQLIGTTDGKTIVTNGKPQVDDDAGLVSYKNTETGRVEQIDRDQVESVDGPDS